MFYYLAVLLISFVIFFLFYMVSYKFSILKDESSPFECGFTSFSQTNFSFSIHYLLFVFMFLLLDLEFSLTFWYFYSSSYSSFTSLLVVELFLTVVLISLIYEWYSSKLDWTY